MKEGIAGDSGFRTAEKQREMIDFVDNAEAANAVEVAAVAEGFASDAESFAAADYAESDLKNIVPELVVAERANMKIVVPLHQTYSHAHFGPYLLFQIEQKGFL